jgi:glycosyltransferase involved in cell wall biosynthesis
MLASMSNGVVVAYSGVHQAFQLALAAQEAGLLERFYCSLFDAPGKLGHALNGLLGPDTLTNRRCSELKAALVSEIPGPFLGHRIAARLPLGQALYPWYEANFHFDAAVAAKLARSRSRVFVGVETCARDCMRVAKRKGMTCVYDCPQVHPDFLGRTLARAADDLRLPLPPPFDPPVLAGRKRDEFAMADAILVLSNVHRRSFVEAGFPVSLLHEVPLWVDPEFWYPSDVCLDAREPTPLRVLFVGNIGLRKGIPYLVRAVDLCGAEVELRMVGLSEVGASRFVPTAHPRIRVTGGKTKIELRKIYGESDVLVLPSLVDTFGFVALEAMACGLPVIITENCGVPVPDESWRVPIMNSEAIATRLMIYARDRGLLRAHGKRAVSFARQYTPERYREGIKKLLLQLLGKTTS